MTGNTIECTVDLHGDDLVMSNHHVHDVSIMPGVVFIDLVLRIVSAKGIEVTGICLDNIRFFEPVATSRSLDKELSVEIRIIEGSTGSVAVSSRPKGDLGEYVLNMRAELSRDSGVLSPKFAVSTVQNGSEKFTNMDELYRRARQEGIVHGAAMRCTGTLARQAGGLLVELAQEVPDTGFLMHPAALDATTIAAFGQTPDAFDDPFIPISIERFRYARPLPERFLLFAPAKERLAETGDVITNSYSLYDLEGNFCASFDRLACKRIRGPELIARLLSTQVATDAKPVRASARHTDYRSLLAGWISALLGVEPNEIDPKVGFYSLGLDSRNLLEISERLEAEFSLPVYPTLLFEHSNIASLSIHLQQQYGDLPLAATEAPVDDAGPALLDSTTAAATVMLVPAWMPDSRSVDDQRTVQIRAINFASEDLHELGVCLPPTWTLAEVSVPTVAKTGDTVWLVSVPTEVALPAAVMLWANEQVKRIAANLEPAEIIFLARAGAPLAGLSGLAAYCASIRLESPRLNSRVVLVDGTNWVSSIVGEVLRGPVALPVWGCIVRYQGSARAVLALAECASQSFSAIDWDQFGDGDVCIISGGGGGIARHLCRWLLDRAPRLTLVLLGRSEQPPSWLEPDFGAAPSPVYVRCDVTRLADVNQAIARFRTAKTRVRAVFHAAASVPQAIHLNLSGDEIERTIAPKCSGFEVLDEATRSDPLLWFVSFSSLATRCPNPGQSAYAFSNAALERLSVERAENPDSCGATMCIAWPLWADGGLQLGASQLERASRSTGMLPLPTIMAIDCLETVIANHWPISIVAYGDRASILKHFSIDSASPRPVKPLDSTKYDRDDAIAIVGLAGRFPGADDIEEFWDLLRSGRDAITPVPADRWTIAGDTAVAAVRNHCGGFLSDIDAFDAKMFHISRKEAETLDPQERLFLETCWTLLEGAGYPASITKGAEIGVFVGVMWNHYQLYRAHDLVAPPAMHAAIANRVSYTFDFKGPSLAIDTACSSSLSAVGAAIDAIRLGHCRMAIAGGVNLAVHPEKYRQLSAGKFLSEDGRCRSFGAGGTGYVPGEGVGAVLLKPLSAAIADGDHVWAVVSGFAAKHSGQTGGFTVPNAAAQADVIRQAWAQGEFGGDSISYIEAHGTGTSLGDPIEIEGLALALGKDKQLALPIGSVKSNVGHLESAAGIAAIAKVLLMMREGELVPSLHSSELNPRLPLAGTGLQIVQARAPWRGKPSSDQLRAGISSFGAGGANTHLVLDRYPIAAKPETNLQLQMLIPVSSPNTDCLINYIKRLNAALMRSLAAPQGEAVYRLLEDMTGLAMTEIEPSDTLAALGLRAIEISRLGGQIGAELTAENCVRDLGGSCPGQLSSSISLPAIAYQLQCRRTHFSTRAAFVAQDLGDLIGQLTAMSEGGGSGRPEPLTALAMLGASWVEGKDYNFSNNWIGDIPDKIDLPVTQLLRTQRFWPGKWKAETNTIPKPTLGSGSGSSFTASSRLKSSGEGKAMAGSLSDNGVVQVEFGNDGVAFVKMNDAPNHNMFTEKLLHELETSFAEIATRDDIRAVVIAGTARVFSLGGTPETLEKLARKDMDFTAAPFLYTGLRTCPVPVVAAVQGRAAGGGLAFALHADLVVLDREGLFSANFVKFGFTPGLGATFLLERYFGSLLAQEMCLTGRDYRGADLEANGAQARFAARDQVLETAFQLARSIAQNPMDAVRALKQEYSKRATAGLTAAIGDEVAMHENVLGKGAIEQVRLRTKNAATAVASSPAPAFVRPVVSPAVASDGPSLSAISNLLLDAIESALFIDRDEIDPNQAFGEMGLDSLGAVEIVHAINAQFGCDLESVLVYDFPTITTLALEVARALTGPSLVSAAAQVAAIPHDPAVPPDQFNRAILPVRQMSPDRNSHSEAVAMVPEALVIKAAEARATGQSLSGAGKIRLSVATGTGADKPQPDVTAAAFSTTTKTDSLDAESFPASDIAIIGMSARYPGSNDIEQFWQRLLGADLQVKQNTDHRWKNSELWDAQTASSENRWVGFIDGIDRFDAAFFGISPREAELMDPQQRVFLEQAWRALEHAGYAVGTDAELDCGVFVGTASGDYLPALHARGVGNSGQVFLGNSCSVLAGRIAYFLNMRGPTIALDTACSSSLVAVHLAIQAIKAGDCAMALAGGIGLMVTPQMHVWNANSGMLSERGRCAAFDSSADGFVLGEGAGIVVLKPLAQAVADRDQIFAVIKASGINGDGRTNGITAPSAEAQLALQRRVHARSKVGIDDIGYIETHGAGTQLGDPIEAKALTQLVRDRSDSAGPCRVGSIKSNLGHTTLAAGVAGLLKVTLGLSHRKIPASLHFDQLNENIRLDPGKLRIAAQAESWQPARDGLCYAAVNSFGVSGTNCHLVLSEAPPVVEQLADKVDAGYLLAISAKSPKALVASLKNLRDVLTAGASLPDVAFTLAMGRTRFTHRAAFAAVDITEALAEIDRRLSVAPVSDDLGETVTDLSCPDWSSPLSREDLEQLAQCFVRGIAIEFSEFFKGRAGKRAAMPGYPLDSRRYWFPDQDERITAAPTEAKSLGMPCRTLVEVVDESAEWVAQHQVGGHNWLPGAAVLYWIFNRLSPDVADVRDVQWLVPAEVTRREEIYAVRASASAREVEFGFELGGPWARGVMHSAAPPQPPSTLDFLAAFNALPSKATKEQFYNQFDGAGIRYGVGYRLVREVRYDQRIAIGLLERNSGPCPQLYDAILQVAASLMPPGERHVPQRIGQVWRYAPVELSVAVKVENEAQGCFTITAYDAEGKVTLSIRQFELAPVRVSSARAYSQGWAPRSPDRGASQQADNTTGTATLTFADLGHDSSASALSGIDHIWLDCRDAPNDHPEAALSLIRSSLPKILDLVSEKASMTLLTAGASRVLASDHIEPTQAAVQAKVRAAVGEYRQMSFRAIDLPFRQDGKLVALPQSYPVDGLAALRGDVWYEPVLYPLERDQPALPPIERGKNYLIVGGAGGLGFALSQVLAAEGANISWIGRRAYNAEIADKMAVIARLGAVVRYESADVADQTELLLAIRKLRADLGPISGAYHSALDLRDGLLAKMTEEDLQAVLRPKVAGLKALHAALEGEPIRHLVLFSSIAAQMSAPGQASYAAASAYMDSLACDLRQRLGTPIYVIDWGYWGTIGVVSDQRHARAMAALGVGSIEPNEGFAWLWHQLAMGIPEMTVLKAEPARLSEFGLRIAGPATPGGTVETRTAEIPDQSAPAAGAACIDAAVTPPITYVASVFAGILKTEIDELDLDATFETYGVDSLIAMDVVRQLKRDLGELPSTLLYERLTIREVCLHLERNKARELEQLLSLSPASTAGAAALAQASSSAISHTAILPEPAVAAPALVNPQRSSWVPHNTQRSEIAIVGLAGRFPGASDLDGFWANLRAGERSITAPPASRGDWQRLFSERRVRNRTYNIQGGFLDQIDRFDAQFFGILPSDAAAMDPQERVFLELCWGLLESAGHNGEVSRQSQTGVFVGSMYGSYGQMAAAAGWNSDRYDLGHSPMWSIANRVSYYFNFSGPSMCVDTACSSSLTAIHLACEALRREECKEAIAGGVNLILHPAHHVALSGMQMLGTGAACRTFDSSADGIVPGEGLGAVLLRPLADAVADGDEILAVICGNMINAGGKTGGYTVPNPAAQADVMQRALQSANIAVEEVGCIEVHGTGTALGDPIEIAALNQVFDHRGGAPIWVGSVKANIGHLEGAAGIAGLAKAILQLRHREIAPCAGLDEISDKIEFTGRVRPARVATPWEKPVGGRRICGVSSFGAGGANAHVLLGEFEPPSSPKISDGEQLFLLSAANSKQLASYARKVADWLDKKPDVSLAELAYSSQVGRRALPARAAIYAQSIGDLQQQLVCLSDGCPADHCFTSETTGRSDLLKGEIGRSLSKALIAGRQLKELAQLWTAGIVIDWPKLWASPPNLVTFPTVPFDGASLWFERPQASEPSFTTEAKGQPADWLSALASEHRIDNHAILPGAAIVELSMALAAANGASAIVDFRWLRPTRLIEVQGLELTDEGEGRYVATVNAGADKIATFALRRDNADPGVAIAPDLAAGTAQQLNSTAFYSALERGGFAYGPKLQVIRQMTVGESAAVAELVSLAEGDGAITALIDGAMQSVALLCSSRALPVGFAECRWFDRADAASRVFAEASERPGIFQLHIVDSAGNLVGWIKDFQVAPHPVAHYSTSAAVEYLVPTAILQPLPALRPVPQAVALFCESSVLRLQLQESARLCATTLVDVDRLAESEPITTALIVFTDDADPASLLASHLNSLFRAIDTLRERRAGNSVRCVVATLDFAPASAALAAATRSLGMENPWLEITHAALESWDLLNAAILESCVEGDCAAEVVLRGNARTVRQLVSIEPGKHLQPSVVPGALYIVIGGTGGIGRHISERLARLGPITVAVIARSDPSILVMEWLKRTEAHGLRIVHRRADVADQADFQRIVTALVTEFGPLKGVIHAAGIVLDDLAKNKTTANILQVLSSKVAGTIALDRCIASHDLDFLILCSSLAGEVGSIGQADYAAANRFLTNFAEAREARRLAGLCSGHSVAIAWPLWLDGGMTVDPATQRMFEAQFGMAPLATVEGLAAFDRALSGQLRSFAVVQPSGTKPRGIAVVCKEEIDTLVAETRAPCAHLQVPLLQRIAELAAEFLLVPSNEVELDRPLLEIGFDSISLTDLANRLNAEFTLDLLPSVMFECPTFRDVAAYLENEHGAQINGTVACELCAGAETGQRLAGPIGCSETASFPHQPAFTMADNSDPEQIAVIGMAGRFAGASSVAEFWQKLNSGEEMLRQVGSDRPDLLGDPLTACMRAGLMHGIDQFDCSIFGISPREAALMDPQQRLFLETTYEAIQDAGYSRSRLAGRDIGVFAGVSTSDYDTLLTQAGVADDPHVATGISHAVLANRVSHVFNWTGPSVIVDTACSSSLVALAQAVSALRQNECSLACIGGVNAILAPGLFHAFDRSGMLSKDFRCKTFDVSADGYVRGEGVGVVVLKRLSDALRDGDVVRAVIRSVAVNHVGKSTSLTAPNPAAQAAVIRKAMAAAKVEPASIGYIETHGTGTKLGDLVEIEGLKTAFGRPEQTDREARRSTRLGAVKTAIGHLEAAAGIAGLIKAILCLENNRLVANRNLETENPALRLGDSPFALINQPERWTERDSDLRRAGVSSFGFGGTNAHAVVDSFPRAMHDNTVERLVCVPVAAPSKELLTRYASALSDAIGTGDMTLSEVARTLREGRDIARVRVVLVCESRTDLLTKIGALAQDQLPQCSLDRPELAPHERTAAMAWLEGKASEWPQLSGSSCSLPAMPFDRKAAWFERPVAHVEKAKEFEPGSSPRRVAGQIVLELVADALPVKPRQRIQMQVLDSVVADQAAESTAAASEKISNRLIAQLSDLLMIPPDQIEVSSSFTDMGLDSILRMDLARSLNVELGLTLTGADLYEYDTVECLTAAINLRNFADVDLEMPARPSPAEAFATVSPIPSTGGLIARIVFDASGIEVSSEQEFVAAGLSSFDMLKAIAELEQIYGPLPKTLLFDFPTPSALEAWLNVREPLLSGPVREKDRSTGLNVAIGDEILVLPSGAIVAPKKLLKTRPDLVAVLSKLDAAHGKEHGLPGRDIAPFVFIGGNSTGYLNFAQRGRVLVSWNSCVAEPDFVDLAGEWVTWAESCGLTPNLLSMAPVSVVGGVPFHSTAFGTVQRISHLGAFSLKGKRMARLRDKLNAFARHGDSIVREYCVGSNPETDLRIVTLIDEWASRKSMVNPYVSRVRQEIGNGVLADHHRMFLCAQDNVDLVAIIVTKIASENGYLLDLEFFADAMPDGGIDFTVVRILDILRSEGVEMFSFGATLGVKLFDSPNPHPAVEEALGELRRSGIFNGEGNLRFKNKYRPEALPIYMCQPETLSVADLSTVLLAITSPTVDLDLPLVGGMRACAKIEAVHSVQAYLPAQPRGQVLPDVAGMAKREQELRRVGWNAMELPAQSPPLNLVSDSWAERDDPYIEHRMSKLRGLALNQTPGSSLLPFKWQHPMPTGKSAEALLLQSLSRSGRNVILQNYLFPSWTYHSVDLGFVPKVIASDPFTGALDLDQMANLFEVHAGDTALCCIELAPNALGGPAFGLETLQAARDLADKYGVLLVFDATRGVGHALAIAEQEGRPAETVFASICGLADAVTLSLSKEYGLNFGGLIATGNDGLIRTLRGRVDARGHDVGLAGRAEIGLALSDRDWLFGNVRTRAMRVKSLANEFHAAGVQVKAAGVHALLLDCNGLFSGASHAVPSALASLYHRTGIRAAPHLAAGCTELRNTIRLAVPVGMAEQEFLALQSAVRNGMASGQEIGELLKVASDGTAPARYLLRADLPDDIAADLQSGVTSGCENGNWQIVSKWQPRAKRHILDIKGSPVEVFEAGNGDPLVLLHPFNVGAGFFAPQFKDLAQSHRVIVIHAPGAGQTAAIADLGFAGLAGQIVDTVDALGVSDQFVLAGASFGGLTALSVALRFPSRVSRLVLLGSSYKVGNRKGEINRLATVVDQDCAALEAAGKGGQIERAELAMILAQCETMDPKTGLRYLDVFASRPDLLEAAKSLRTPTVLIHGAHDTVIPVDIARTLAGAIPDSRLVVLDNAGHFPSLTSHNAVNALIIADGVLPKTTSDTRGPR